MTESERDALLVQLLDGQKAILRELRRLTPSAGASAGTRTPFASADVLAVIAAEVGKRWFTAAELVDHARQASPLLMAALEDACPGKVNSRAIGWLLKRLLSTAHPKFALVPTARSGNAWLYQVTPLSFEP